MGSGITLTSSALSSATGLSNQIASAGANTITHNVGWFFLIATLALIVTLITYLATGLISFGKGMLSKKA